MYKCEICGRNNKQQARCSFNKEYNGILCRQHANHFKKYGKFFKWNIYSENEYILKENTAEIILRNNKMDIVGKCIIDINDYNKIKCFKWRYSHGYCVSNKIGSIHSFLLGKKDGKCIDHINRNRLDCRRCNLRHTTYTVNGWNKGKQSNNTSGIVGVSWNKKKNKWESHIKIQYGKKFLGYYNNIEDAKKAREKAEILYFGEKVNRINDNNTVFKKQN